MTKAIHLLSLLLLVGCTQKKNYADGEDVLKIDIKDAVLLNEISPTSLIDINKGNQPVPGTIYEAKIYGDTLWAIDITKAKGLYAFDKTGRNILTLNERGNGPGEMMDFDGFDADGSYIYLTDSSARRIKIFNKNTGKYISEFDILPYAMSMAAKDCKIWYDRGNASYYHGDILSSKLLSVDSARKETTLRTIPTELDELSIYPRGAFAKWGDNVHYYPSMEPAIYSLTPDSAKLVYSIDFVDHWPSKEYFTDLKELDIFGKVKRLTEDGYVINLCFLENETWLHFNFNVDKVFYLYFYNKAAEESFIIKDPEERLYHPIALKGDNVYISTDQDGIIEIYDINLLTK